MTRLAIIFSLLFVTPAWAESKAMNCDRFVTFKYETGSGGHKCYHRKNGRWEEMVKSQATDWSCISEVNIVDFVEKTLTMIYMGEVSVLDCKYLDLPD